MARQPTIAYEVEFRPHTSTRLLPCPTIVRRKPTVPSRASATPKGGPASPSSRHQTPLYQSETATGHLFLDFVAKLHPVLERHLQRRLSSELKRVRALGPEAMLAYQAFSDVCMRGGKRLRAALVMAGGQCFGKRHEKALLTDLGAAVEVLHAYFLVHDDWMDGDALRRGGPSAHASLHRHYGVHLGDAAAVLAGDWGAAIANDWVAQARVGARDLPTLLSAFADMQRAAIGGQLRDVLATDGQVELTYRLKTASYTVEGPLVLGATAAGATAKQIDTIRRFATPAGIAFQLRDDLIGMFGSVRETGKPFGSDLRAGKRTAVALHALATATKADAKIIGKAFGNATATAMELRSAVAAIERTGSRKHVETRIARLTARACRELSQPWVTEQARELLTSAAVALAVRSQ